VTASCPQRRAAAAAVAAAARRRKRRRPSRGNQPSNIFESGPFAGNP
jgi:hypothetical protein